MLPVLRIHQISESGFNSNGDSTLLQYSDHFRQTNVLVDCGIGKGIATRYLQEIGVEKVDLIIASHIDLDHIGGLRDVLIHIDVTELWVMNIDPIRRFVEQSIGFEREKYHFMRCLTQTHRSIVTAGNKNVKCSSVYEGYSTKIGPFFLEVLWPPTTFERFLQDPLNIEKILRTSKGRTYKTFLEEGHTRDDTETEVLTENNKREIDTAASVIEYSEDLSEYSEELLHENFKLASRGLLNNMSVVVRISCLAPSCPTSIFEPLSMLFPGDLEDWTHLLLKYHNYVNTPVLKVPHHGSIGVNFKGRSLYRFLRPHLSLVFPYSRHGLPSRNVIATLARNGLISCVSCKKTGVRSISDECCHIAYKCISLDTPVYEISPHGFKVKNGQSICKGIFRS